MAVNPPPRAVLHTTDLAASGPVIPVIVIEDAAHALPLARALLAGGVEVLEITLRTPAALAAIAAIARDCPQAIVGAGTVRNARDAAAASEAGARFAVSPGFTPAVAAGCHAAGLPLLPGVASASELMQATEAGFTFLKFFPAEAAGGVAMLKAWASPFPDATFCPTGGIGAANAVDYLALANVRCVGGSWIVPAASVAAGDWDAITALARAAAALPRRSG